MDWLGKVGRDGILGHGEAEAVQQRQEETQACCTMIERGERIGQAASAA